MKNCVLCWVGSAFVWLMVLVAAMETYMSWQGVLR